MDDYRETVFELLPSLVSLDGDDFEGEQVDTDDLESEEDDEAEENDDEQEEGTSLRSPIHRSGGKVGKRPAGKMPGKSHHGGKRPGGKAVGTAGKRPGGKSVSGKQGGKSISGKQGGKSVSGKQGGKAYGRKVPIQIRASRITS